MRMPALIDHHCHGLVADDLDRAGFEALMNEAPHASPLATTLFDSMLGLAIRRHCAPLLDLEPLVDADAYLARRRELGAPEVNRRLLGAAGIDTFVVDTGLWRDVLTSPEETAAYAGGSAHEIIRLEWVAEQVLQAGTDDFAGEVVSRLQASGAVGAKSIAAYRVGLELPATKPSADELASALAGVAPERLVDKTVSAWLAHTAVELGLPLQFHVGYGDSDLDLLQCDPLRLTAFLRGTVDRGVPVLLLHNWPFHRNAAYLSQVFDHVFMDLGLATHNAGVLSRTLLRETLELVPFGKLLFSSDAFGLAELYLVAALMFREAAEDLLGRLVEHGEMTDNDAQRLVDLVARENAVRAYGLDPR
ncbi:amidohydrolase [Nocardioides mangrovicus]|uniref:Amidohydrolase n=1 Tax=Nocardioides mangrovicus TaxID=2478913 RepID=A0A3L8NYX0_9ACTN|nr:amidohydrolase family protein [Nocardioides mangrovicus]RLV47559.1 amidohydrolase [Nocardioides mangrovicus]